MASDLHIHTAFSDGKLSPEDLVEKAKSLGLKYIAVTDHDTVDGMVHLYENGIYPSRSINIIPGVEMSAADPDHEVHILGYNVDIYNRDMAERLNDVGEARWGRFAEIIGKLKELDYAVTEAEVLSVAGASKSISRSHIARALVKRGFFPTVRAAFDALLDRGKPAYVPHFRLTVEEILSLIKNAGGLSFLAHPKLVGDDEYVKKLLDMGFDGLEVYYPEHDKADTEKYTAMAEKRGLMVSGGSDFHGFTARHPMELGNFTVPDEVAEKIYKPQ